MAGFGHFLGVSAATEMKVNLREVWLKVRCKLGVSVPLVLDLHLPYSCHQIRLEVFSPENTLLRSLTGLADSRAVSSADSRCEEVSKNGGKKPIISIDEVVVGGSGPEFINVLACDSNAVGVRELVAESESVDLGKLEA